MSYRFSSRLQGVGLSMIRQIIQKSEGCIDLGIGEPHFFAPEIVREAAHRALEEEKAGYSPTAGLPQLQERVRRYHGDLPGQSVCITNGSQESLFNLLFALLDPGDEVLVPDPGYVAYPTVVRLAGGEPVPYPLERRDHFQLQEESLKKRISERTRAIILVSPSNPTGQCLSLAQLSSVSALAEDHDLLPISDEIYREIYYTPEKPPTIADVTDRALILSGVSKMASMTGWRIGWACGPDEVIEKVTVMHQYTSICASTLAQRATLEIFTREGQIAVEKQRKLLEINRDLICSWVETHLDRAFVPPQAAFYLMLSVEDLELDSFSVAMELLKDKVTTIPGSAFGDQGEGFLRLSFACPQDQLLDGMERIKKGLRRLTR